MTVQELIEKLQAMDLKSQFCIYDGGKDYHAKVFRVKELSKEECEQYEVPFPSVEIWDGN